MVKINVMPPLGPLISNSKIVAMNQSAEPPVYINPFSKGDCLKITISINGIYRGRCLMRLGSINYF
jgi:hypothetical protein